jgi:hypothetical protein
MRKPQFGELLERRRQSRQRTSPLQAAQRPKLSAGGPARADEVRVVGVREPVRTRLRRPDDAALREREDGAGRARGRQQLSDRLRALGVRGRVVAPFLNRHLDALRLSDFGDELSACPMLRPDLQVPRGDAPAAEQRTAQVGAAAAGTTDHPLRRPLERRQPGADDAGLVEHLHRARLAGHVELVPRLPAEGAPAVAPDLAGHAESAQEAERAPSHARGRQIEVQRDLAAAAQVDATGGVEERRELREAVALPPRGDPG